MQLTSKIKISKKKFCMWKSRTCRIASMKHKLNFPPGGKWCYFYNLRSKMAPPSGEIKFFFHTNNAKFPDLSHVKKITWISSISYEWCVTEVLWWRPIRPYPKYKLLWDKIARPYESLSGDYPVETCFSSYFFINTTLHPNLFCKKIIKKSLVKSEKLHFCIFCVTFKRPYWPTVNQNGKTCF